MKECGHHLPAWPRSRFTWRHLETPPVTHQWGTKSCGGGQEWGKGLLTFLYILSRVSIFPLLSLCILHSPEKWCSAGTVSVWDLSVYPKHYLMFSLLELKHLRVFLDFSSPFLPPLKDGVWICLYSTKEPKGRTSGTEVPKQLRSKVKSWSSPAWHSSAETHPQPPFLLVLKENSFVCFCTRETTTEAKDFFILQGTRTQATPFALLFYSYLLVSPPRIPKSLSVCLISPCWLSGEFVRSLPYPSPQSFFGNDSYQLLYPWH